MAIHLEVSKPTIYEQGSFNHLWTLIQKMTFKLVGHQQVEFVTNCSREKKVAF